MQAYKLPSDFSLKYTPLSSVNRPKSLMPKAVGDGSPKAVEYKCPLLGWYLGDLLDFVKLTSSNVAPAVMVNLLSTTVIFTELLTLVVK